MTLMRGLNDDLRLDVAGLPDARRAPIRDARVCRSWHAGLRRNDSLRHHLVRRHVLLRRGHCRTGGLRSVCARCWARRSLVFPAPDAETFEDALLLCRRFIEHWNGHPLIQPAVAPRLVYGHARNCCWLCADLARAFSVPLHTHVSETKLEAENSVAQNHMSVVTWLEQHGILDTGCWPPIAFTSMRKICSACRAGRGGPLPVEQSEARQRHRADPTNAQAGAERRRRHRRHGQQQRFGHGRGNAAGVVRFPRYRPRTRRRCPPVRR